MNNLYRIRNFIFICIFGIFTFFQVFANTYSVFVNSRFSYIIVLVECLFLMLMLLLSIDVFFSSLGNFILFLVISIVLVFMYINQGYNELIFPLLAFFCIKIIGLQTTLKVDFYIRLSSIALIIILSSFNYLLSNNVINSVNGKLRYSLGFSNPNALSQMLFVLFLESIILRFSKNRIRFTTFILFDLLIVLFVSKSRTTIILMIAFLFINYFLTKHFNLLMRHQWVRLSLIGLPIIFFMLMFVLVSLYSEKDIVFFNNLNFVLSNRLGLAAFYLNKYPITLWGQRIVTHSGIGLSSINYGALDIGYINLLIKFGAIPSFVFIILMSLTLHKLINNKKITYLAAFIVFIFLGLSEATFYYTSYNVTLYMFSILLNYKYTKV